MHGAETQKSLLNCWWCAAVPSETHSVENALA